MPSPDREACANDARVSAELPSPADEYRERQRQGRGEMRRRELDVLLVLSPPNLRYLTARGAPLVQELERALAGVGATLVDGS